MANSLLEPGERRLASSEIPLVLACAMVTACCHGGSCLGHERALTNDPRSWVVLDRFGRALNVVGINLVDWDGQLANPVVKLSISPPRGIQFPAQVALRATARGCISTAAPIKMPAGLKTTFTFANRTSSATLYLSIWPDHDSKSEDYLLVLRGGGVETRIPIHVKDEDQPFSAPFHIVLDYSGDDLKFLADATNRRVVEQVAADWAYFVDDMHLDAVAPKTQRTDLISVEGNTEPLKWRTAWNEKRYTGFLLYVFGVHSADPRKLTSGGAPSWAGTDFQSSGGPVLAGQLRRSGSLNIEIAGNYNSRGWISSVNDEDWFKTENLGSEVNDLLSIVHHEMGHALIFNPGYAKFGAYKAQGQISDSRVVRYYGAPVPIDPTDHLYSRERHAGAIDPASLLGAFGNEYADDGIMPRGRWITTKLDMLCAQAMGYPIRRTSAFVPVSIDESGSKVGVVGRAYDQTLVARGGIPTYYWRVTAGTLPAGLALDSFSGRIPGAPTRQGLFEFEIGVSDIGLIDATVTQSRRIEVRPR